MKTEAQRPGAALHPSPPAIASTLRLRVRPRPRLRPRAIGHRTLRPGLPPTILQRRPQAVPRPAPIPAVATRPDARGRGTPARAALMTAGVSASSALATSAPPIEAPRLSPPLVAPIPCAAPQTVNMLALRGEYWEVTFNGRTSIVEDCRGLRYIAVLIRDARGERGPMHAKELVAVATGQPAVTVELESPEPLVDEAARTQLLKRLEEIAFARTGADDDATAAALDEEYERIAETLSAGAAAHGRRGVFNSASERARKAVGKAISEAIARLASCPGQSALAAHLTLAVRKGLWLSYGGAVAWTIEFGPRRQP